MTDYREEFYANYHITNQYDEKPDEAHYKAASLQFDGRWRKWLPPDKSSKCLDLACGNGEFLFYLKSQGYNYIYGVDLNEIGIRHAAQMNIPNLECRDIIEYLRDCDIQFDMISAFNLFEHLRKDEILELLHLVFQSLKSGGKLIIVTPNALSPFSGTTRYWDFSHETSFTPASWRQLARLRGFESATFEEYGPISHSIIGSIRTMLWHVIRLVIMAVAYVEVASPRDVSRVYTADMKIILTK